MQPAMAAEEDAAQQIALKDKVIEGLVKKHSGVRAQRQRDSGWCVLVLWAWN